MLLTLLSASRTKTTTSMFEWRNTLLSWDVKCSAILKTRTARSPFILVYKNEICMYVVDSISGRSWVKSNVAQNAVSSLTTGIFTSLLLFGIPEPCIATGRKPSLQRTFKTASKATVPVNILENIPIETCYLTFIFCENDWNLKVSPPVNFESSRQ